MTRILAPDDPIKEHKRLLGQARHCRDLARSCDDARLIEELIAIANSYEATASLLLPWSVANASWQIH